MNYRAFCGSWLRAKRIVGRVAPVPPTLKLRPRGAPLPAMTRDERDPQPFSVRRPTGIPPNPYSAYRITQGARSFGQTDLLREKLCRCPSRFFNASDTPRYHRFSLRPRAKSLWLGDGCGEVGLRGGSWLGPGPWNRIASPPPVKTRQDRIPQLGGIPAAATYRA